MNKIDFPIHYGLGWIVDGFYKRHSQPFGLFLEDDLKYWITNQKNNPAYKNPQFRRPPLKWSKHT